MNTSTKMNMSEPDHSEQRFQHTVVVLLLGVGLTMFFWLDLWLGGGLIGGDIYTYYMPQKSFFADSLKLGTIPLWNPLVGHGYPLVAESQTGVYYPPNLLLYSLFDVNTAYNLNHLIHYIFAFVMSVVFARECGLGRPAALLGALVFVYSWFPPRCCLEWAILTGAYLPACLWLLLRYQKTNHLGWLWGLAGCLCLQLLAGHFNLAFITQLAIFLVASSTYFLEIIRKKSDAEFRFSSSTKKAILPGIAIIVGVLLASIQLLPTWALKQNSQRETSFSAEFDPAYGHIPPEYLSQVFLPWAWYGDSSTLDAKLGQMNFLASNSGTNAVEAHLYFGMLPLILAGLGLWIFMRRSRKLLPQAAAFNRRFLLILAGIGLFGLMYATGLLLPAMQDLPGFGFFRGPGRYGILTTLAVAIWAGYGFEQLLRHFSFAVKSITLLLVMSITILDYSWVSQRITYAFMVAETPIRLRDKSPVRQLLADKMPPARLFAPGQNLVTTLGVAATPVYLGIGPAEYFDPQLQYPAEENLSDKNISEVQLSWLNNAGVTHVLSFERFTQIDSALKLIWQGHDPLLNSAWGRREPLYLYQLTNSRGRASWKDNATANRDINWKGYHANAISLELSTPSKSKFIFTDLYDEDWLATLDGAPVKTERFAGMYRSLAIPAGAHELKWEYQPRSVRLGKWISIATFTIWILVAILFHVQKKRCN